MLKADRQGRKPTIMCPVVLSFNKYLLNTCYLLATLPNVGGGSHEQVTCLPSHGGAYVIMSGDRYKQASE